MADTNEIGLDTARRDDLVVEDSTPLDIVVTDNIIEDKAKVSVTAESETELIVDLRGLLDDEAGGELLDVLNRGVVDGIRRVAIDLRQVDGLTEEGAQALAACRDLGQRFPDGLHYRSDSGPGREALMVALADLSTDDDLA